MDLKHGGKDRRIRLQATNNFLRVKNINKGWDKVLDVRVKGLRKQLQRTTNALHRDADVLEGELKAIKHNITYLDDRTLQIQTMKRDLEKAKERIPEFLKEDKPVTNVVLWSPSRQVSREVHSGRTDGEAQEDSMSASRLLQRSDERSPAIGSSSLAPIIGPDTTDPRSVPIPCRFYKSHRRPVPPCHHFPCQPPRSYYSMNLCHSKGVLHKTISSTALYPDLLRKSGRVFSQRQAPSPSSRGSSGADAVLMSTPGVHLLAPSVSAADKIGFLPSGPWASSRTHILSTQEPSTEELGAKSTRYKIERPPALTSRMLDGYDSAGINVKHDSREPLRSKSPHEQRTDAASGSETYEISRAISQHKNVSFSNSIPPIFQSKNDHGHDVRFKEKSSPRKHLSQTSRISPSETTKSFPEEVSGTASQGETSGEQLSSKTAFQSMQSSLIRRKNLDRVEALAVAMDSQRKRNEEMKPTPREVQYGQATPLRILLKEGNPSSYAKRSGLCL